MACVKHSAGKCCFAPGELPTLEIPGMHSYTGWILNCCCASITFEYDSEQAYVKYDGGDVMSYDKTTTKTYEAFYYPITCGQVLTGWYTEGNSSGYAGEEHFPAEPAYTGCCPDAITLNTTIVADRIRGGRRFVLAIRPLEIKITIQKATITCDETTSEKYIVTINQGYDGYYEYVDYEERSTTATKSNIKACWDSGGSVLGSYPFDIDDWEPSVNSTPIVPYYFCARQNRERLPPDETPPEDSFIFTIDDTGGNCYDDIPGCAECEDPIPDCLMCTFVSEVCFDSGPTGITEPSFGFCTLPTHTTRNYTLNHSPLCYQHKLARFYRGNAAPGDAGYFTPGIIQNLGDGCTAFDGTTWPPANCTRNFSYVGIEPGGINLSPGDTGNGMLPYASLLTGGVYTSPTCDVWSTVCDNCWPFESDEDYDPGTTTTNYDALYAYKRVVAASVALTCSGYVQREICIPFPGWTVNII
tara:strand:- start:2325 stop:3737 length:1413 start_codon:yes stop_codon:yes gene_type:complete